MTAKTPDPLPYATQKVPETLVDRIKCQNGREKLDLTLCHIVKIPLQAISDNYDGTPVYLDLSFNAIRFVAPQFSRNFISLTKLDLGRNKIKRLPDNFGLMQGLVYLDIRRNQLETLPVSMGKMKRLRFLCLSDNPFRPHLRDFLGERVSEITPVALAELVVHFLDEVATAHTPEPPQSVSRSSVSLGKRRSMKVHYSSRSLRMAGDGDSVSSFSSGGNRDEVHHVNSSLGRAQIKSKEASYELDNTPWLSKVMIAGIFIIMTIIFAGYIAETPFLDSFAEDHPTFNPFWGLYRPIHEGASWTTKWIPKNPSYVFTAPPLNTLGKSISFVGKVKQTLLSVGIWLNLISPN